VYHTFRIQLALDIVSGGASSRDRVPLIRAVPGVATVPHGMQVQWYVHQEEPFVAFLPDFPEGMLVWEVLFNGRSPCREASYRCTLKTTAEDLKTPLVHCADAEPVRVDQPGDFEYDIRLGDEGGRTISLEHGVLIVA
jgi:hypothetical protein